jgi:acetyl-CoA synthetase
MSSFLAASPPDVYAPIIDKDLQGSNNEIERWNQYRAEYAASIKDSDQFWSNVATQNLSWFSPFDSVSDGGFLDGDVKWFPNGKINACYNCVDRHLATRADQVAIIWEGDEIGSSKKITYRELSQDVCRIANVLKMKGVKKGDVVTIYMPMIPQVAMTMLACARIGAVHSIVFAGFSADSLRDRILDCNSKFLVIADEGKRGGKTLQLRQIAEEAAAQCPDVKHMLIFRPAVLYPDEAVTAAAVNGANGEVDATLLAKHRNPPSRRYGGANRGAVHWEDVWMHDWMPKARPVCPCEWMDSEDDFFILYTSGSTGKPKGVAHTTGGYLTYAALTTKKSFDLKVNHASLLYSIYIYIYISMINWSSC